MLGSNNPDADANGDRIVDAKDYAIWKAHFGRALNSNTSTFVAVPEPAAIGSLAMAILASTLIRLTHKFQDNTQ